MKHVKAQSSVLEGLPELPPESCFHYVCVFYRLDNLFRCVSVLNTLFSAIDELILSAI
jgi:hypothetical protein